MPNFWRFFFALKRENFKFDIDFYRLKILGKNVLRTNDIPWTPTVGQTHLLTLVVKPDQTYQVLVEGRSIFLEAVFEIHIENVRRICSSDQMKSYFFVRLITFRRLMAAWLIGPQGNQRSWPEQAIRLGLWKTKFLTKWYDFDSHLKKKSFSELKFFQVWSFQHLRKLGWWGDDWRPRRQETGGLGSILFCLFWIVWNIASRTRSNVKIVMRQELIAVITARGIVKALPRATCASEASLVRYWGWRKLRRGNKIFMSAIAWDHPRTEAYTAPHNRRRISIWRNEMRLTAM